MIRNKRSSYGTSEIPGTPSGPQGASRPGRPEEDMRFRSVHLHIAHVREPRGYSLGAFDGESGSQCIQQEMMDAAELGFESVEDGGQPVAGNDSGET